MKDAFCHTDVTTTTPLFRSARFDDLLHTHYLRTYRFAYRLTGNRSDAEDLTQDTFIRAHRAFHCYDPQRPFERWLHRIAYRLFLDNLRRQRLPKMFSLDAFRENQRGEASISPEIPDPDSNPENIVLDAILDERLARAVRALPGAFRTAVTLCDIEGMSYEEAAEIMDCSLGTVRSRLHRGRHLLRNALQPEKQTKRASIPVPRHAPPTLHPHLPSLDTLPPVPNSPHPSGDRAGTLWRSDWRA
jgi:RNA polymerase sigma-70 factor (ECF subfamily)